ncbi:TonB-dependent siderophore receptor [Malaciobacter marinus]|uniref:TonB-dependent siderophore receptor n=1 Tax=Malaciobacter marinus TaxID=505249 RepID=A0A347THX5_9BACT|nr:TonB-dependent siderophore receptor [Malaciobacter marinus]AXX86203.1 TonB-dependent siderophore receptor [Malaciobacter marinus]PHO16745.1 TonB-dependent siderophore receptor [Malaciobacter marinus]
MNKKLTNIIVVSLVASSTLLATTTKNIKLDEITVSANKMDETIKQIPQSISIIDNFTIEEKEIKSIPEIIEYIPNLSSTFMYSDRVNFRGINTSIFTNNNPVVIYIDGIPHSSVYAFDASILNIERVEVLRGPQGALYGKDSIGGVINIVTKKPTNETEGFVSLEYGSNNFRQANFNISGAIIKDKLFFGLNGLLGKDDGWQTNHNENQNKDIDKSKFHKLNTTFYYKPTDKLSMNLSLFDDKNYRYGFEGGAIPQNETINDYKREDFKNVNYESDTYMKTKSKAQSLKLEYNFNENVNLSSITANKKVDIDGTWDVDLGNNPNYDQMSMFQDATSKNFSQEFRITGENNYLRYVFGLYFEKDEFNFHNYGQEYPSYLAGNPFGTGVDVKFNAKSKATSKTYASFGQVVIPFLEDYELTLGGRYQKVKKKMNLDNYMHPTNTNATPYFEFNEEHTWNTFLPKIALSKRLNNELSTYITVSKGYLPGGYNNFASNGSEKENRFDAQTSINYELGLRGSLLEDKLYLSSSIFYMDIEDIHVYSTDPVTSMMYTSNAGEATSKGLELELKYNINDNWSIDTAIGIIQAKYSNYKDSNGNDNKNKKIERTPSHSINLGLSYYAGNGLYGRFDIKNQGDMYFNAQNSLKQDSYTVANAKIGYLFKDFDIYAYVKNITDESYIVAVEEMAEFRQLTYGKGRFIGLGLKYSF